MIKFCLQGLREIGFSNEQVYTTLVLQHEVRRGQMPAGGNIGTKYVCKDGPVFRFDQVSPGPTKT